MLLQELQVPIPLENEQKLFEEQLVESRGIPQPKLEPNFTKSALKSGRTERFDHNRFKWKPKKTEKKIGNKKIGSSMRKREIKFRKNRKRVFLL